MLRFRFLLVPVALLAGASAAHAQYRSVSAAAAPARTAPNAQVHQASGGSWNGTASKWGGSPVESRHESRGGIGYGNQTIAYIPVVVAVPVAVYAADTACTPQAAPVDMQVVTSNHDERQLTRLEVYRLQPRFQKPR